MSTNELLLPIDKLSDGKNVLIAGEPKTGKQELIFSILAEFVQQDGGFVVVTGKQTTEDVVKEIESRASCSVNPNKTGVTEMVSGARENKQTSDITEVAATGDLTGVGISFSTQYSRISENAGPPVCLAINSLSRMSMYSELPTMCRFLHVATGLVQNQGGLGVYAIDKPTGNDEVRQFQELVDGLIETRQSDAGYDLRVSGLPEISGEWRSFEA